MSTTFPTSLQDLDATRGTTGQPLSNANHITHHTNEDDTIEALEAKVGVDSSAVTSSLDYKLKNTSSLDPGHKHSTSSVDSTWTGIKMFKGYAADAGASDSYVISAPGGNPGSYTAGDTYIFKANTANTGTASLNVNSNGAVTIVKNYNQTLATGDIVAGQLVEVVYDGSNFQMVSPPVTPSYASGVLSHDISVTTADTIAHGLGAIPKVVRIFGVLGTNNCVASATYISSTQASASITGTTTTNDFRFASTVSSARNEMTITVDATNITLSWSKTGSPSGTANLRWEAQT